MSKFVTKFLKDESGATAIEYGLIVALIAVVIITAVTTLGTKLNVSNRVELAQIALRLGLVRDHDVVQVHGENSATTPRQQP